MERNQRYRSLDSCRNEGQGKLGSMFVAVNVCEIIVAHCDTQRVAHLRGARSLETDLRPRLQSKAVILCKVRIATHEIRDATSEGGTERCHPRLRRLEQSARTGPLHGWNVGRLGAVGITVCHKICRLVMHIGSGCSAKVHDSIAPNALSFKHRTRCLCDGLQPPLLRSKWWVLHFCSQAR